MSKTITGIITWLKDWFYEKSEFDAICTDTGWRNITFLSGYTNYGTGDEVQIRRIDKFVEIRGAFKPTATKTASLSAVQFATIPSDCIPDNIRYAMCQGSQLSRWTLGVTTDGKLTWERYGTTTSINVPSGAWMNVHITYLIN